MIVISHKNRPTRILIVIALTVIISLTTLSMQWHVRQTQQQLITHMQQRIDARKPHATQHTPSPWAQWLHNTHTQQRALLSSLQQLAAINKHMSLTRLSLSSDTLCWTASIPNANILSTHQSLHISTKALSANTDAPHTLLWRACLPLQESHA